MNIENGQHGVGDWLKRPPQCESNDNLKEQFTRDINKPYINLIIETRTLSWALFYFLFLFLDILVCLELLLSIAWLHVPAGTAGRPLQYSSQIFCFRK